VVSHGEKDQLHLLHDAHEGEAHVEVHATLKDIFPQLFGSRKATQAQRAERRGCLRGGGGM